MRATGMSSGIVLVGLFAVLSTPADVVKAAPPETRAAVEAADREMCAAVRAGDVAKLVSFYTQDARLFGAGQPEIRGHEGVRRQMEYAVQMGVSDCRTVVEEIVEGDGMMVSLGQAEFLGRVGQTLARMRYMTLWKLEDGRWRIHRDFSVPASDVVTPTAANAPSADGLDVRVSQPPPLHAVVLPMTGSYGRHGEALARLAAYLGSVGLEPAGAPFGRYHNDPRAVAESDLVWELGFPMAQPAAVSAPFEARTLDDALVATLVVPGPHEASRPWDAFGRWIVDHGYTPEGPAMETWLDGPRTEMRLAVRK